MENMDYVVMLRESLEKKADVLRVLNIRNKEQEAILKDPMYSKERWPRRLFIC